jgi:hypothetical protein
MPLNYSIVETPYSLYVTLRKSLLKSAQNLESLKLKNQDEKVRKLEQVIDALHMNLEEAVVEVEEKAKTIRDLS